ncbi:uncharacterized protein B0H18DRAFT_960555 [Fomitopsis serialis]|uniref:uncharacterized protein n=1 Tax=Fomitopsis serialis TaxID=139415 RepID=UPI002008C074|nr:uncharacterized protein B0H18DRAFT_960555 [Neoantrodia serialis]KAH9913190.1 hypothetical protein B0H18DRAFT_960555 [Neoantrodia serialis]
MAMDLPKSAAPATRLTEFISRFPAPEDDTQMPRWVDKFNDVLILYKSRTRNDPWDEATWNAVQKVLDNVADRIAGELQTWVMANFPELAAAVERREEEYGRTFSAVHTARPLAEETDSPVSPRNDTSNVKDGDHTTSPSNVPDINTSSWSLAGARSHMHDQTVDERLERHSRITSEGNIDEMVSSAYGAYERKKKCDRCLRKWGIKIHCHLEEGSVTCEKCRYDGRTCMWDGFSLSDEYYKGKARPKLSFSGVNAFAEHRRSVEMQTPFTAMVHERAVAPTPAEVVPSLEDRNEEGDVPTATLPHYAPQSDGSPDEDDDAAILRSVTEEELSSIRGEIATEEEKATEIRFIISQLGRPVEKSFISASVRMSGPRLSPTETVLRFLRENPVPEPGIPLGHWSAAYDEVLKAYYSHFEQGIPVEHEPVLEEACTQAMMKVYERSSPEFLAWLKRSHPSHTALAANEGSQGQVTRNGSSSTGSVRKLGLATPQPIMAPNGAPAKVGPPKGARRRTVSATPVTADSVVSRKSSKRKASELDYDIVTNGVMRFRYPLRAAPILELPRVNSLLVPSVDREPTTDTRIMSAKRPRVEEEKAPLPSLERKTHLMRTPRADIVASERTQALAYPITAKAQPVAVKAEIHSGTKNDLSSAEDGGYNPISPVVHENMQAPSHAGASTTAQHAPNSRTHGVNDVERVYHIAEEELKHVNARIQVLRWQAQALETHLARMD